MTIPLHSPGLLLFECLFSAKEGCTQTFILISCGAEEEGLWVRLENCHQWNIKMMSDSWQAAFMGHCEPSPACDSLCRSWQASADDPKSRTCFESAQISLKLLSYRLCFTLIFQPRKVLWIISFFLKPKRQLFLNIDEVCKKYLKNINWHLCPRVQKTF